MNKNKQQWISDKIKKLKKEGKSQEQSVAIAYASYNNMLKGGTYKKDIPKYQTGSYTQGNNYNPIYNPYNYSTPPVDSSLQGYLYLDANSLPPMETMPLTQGDPNINPNQFITNAQAKSRPQQQMLQTNPQGFKDMGYTKENALVELNKNADVANQKAQNTYFTKEQYLKQNPQTQQNNVIFNPFGNIGLEQSLAYAGQGFGSGNNAQGLMGSVLSGLKGARTFMSGFATGKEGRRQDEEYMANMQQEPRYLMDYQEGGSIPYTDKELAYLNKGTGLVFTNEGAQRFNPKAPPLNIKPLDLGMYKDLNYFDVQQQGESYIIRPSKNNLKNAREYKEDLRYIKKLNPDTEIQGLEDNRFYVPLQQRMRQGGVTNADLLTEEYLVENPNQQPSVELEDGEYAENSETGNVQEVVGEKHDKGGVKTDLPDGSKVISDYTKIGGDNAKKFKEEFDVKVRATDTFATVLDKVNKSIGLDSLLEEEKEIYEKIEEQESNKDLKGNVKSLNLTALQKKLQNISEQKKTLKEQQKSAFDKIFEEQEKIPKKKGNNVMKEGGVYKDIDYLSKKYKIDKDRLITLMQEGGEKIDAKKVTKKEAKEMVKKGIWEDLGDGRYVKKGFPDVEFTTVELEEIPSTTTTMTPQRLQSYKTVWESGKVDKNKYKTLEEFTTAAEKWWKENPDKREKITSTTENSLDLIETPEKIEGVPDEFFYVEQEEQKKNVENTSTDNTQNTTEGNKGVPNIPIIPQDFILPPSARQPVYKQSVQLGRIDPVKVSVEPNLVEIERQRQAIDEATRLLPPAQRAAMLANTLGQTQMAVNQAISQTEATNAQGQYNADLYNLQAQAKEDLLNSRFEQDYEAKTMAAIGNQELDVRQYFNDLNNQQRYNFEYVDRRNLLNQAYPNYNVSGSSNIDFAGGVDFKQQLSAYLNPVEVNGKPFSELTDEERDKYRLNQMKKMGF